MQDNNIQQSSTFIKDEKLSWEPAGEGVTRKILGYDDKIMMVRVDFQKGGIGPIHNHFHSQTTYVTRGVFEVVIGGEKQLLKEGDAFYIPPFVDHGAVCLEAGELIDVFSPIREDFMK